MHKICYHGYIERTNTKELIIHTNTQYYLLNSTDSAGKLMHNDGDKTAPSELVDTEERVYVALQGLNVVASTVTVTSRPTDTEEVATISTFMSTRCGCHKLKGSPCSQQFSLSYVEEFRGSRAELTPAELDMVIMGQLMEGMNTSDIVSTLARHKEDDREKCYTTFTHQGKPVRLKMFRFLHGIGEKRLKNLTKNVKSNGLCPRVHGNTNNPDISVFHFH